MDRKLKIGIVSVFAANMINVCFSLLTNFLLPKYLSVDSYAAIKTFQLYTSYVGLLHLGYIDGMYLKYGGIELSQKVYGDLAINLSSMKVFQIAITAVVFAIALLSKDWIVVLFALSILPQNMTNYFKYLYQATGEFKTYGKLINLTTISSFAINMALLFILKSDDYLIYISLYVCVYYLIWLSLEMRFRKIVNFKLFSLSEVVNNIKSGFLLTLGNLASMLLTSMDRWFVKFLLTTLDFALYSFAVSVEGFLNLAITPLTTTLYNFFCREKNEDKHRNILRHIWVFATILPAAAFPVKFILEHFLDKYIGSCNVIFIIFSAQMFYIIIRSVFLNLYKMQKRQTQYFVKLIIVLIVGFAFNWLFYWILSNKEAFAIGTLLSAAVWYILSVRDFNYLDIGVLDYVYLLGELTAFLLCGYLLDSVLGFIIYVLFTLLMIIIFRGDTMHAVLSNFKSVRRKTEK